MTILPVPTLYMHAHLDIKLLTKVSSPIWAGPVGHLASFLQKIKYMYYLLGTFIWIIDES